MPNSKPSAYAYRIEGFDLRTILHSIRTDEPKLHVAFLTTTLYCTSRDQPDWHYMADGIPTVKDITGSGRSTILVDPEGLQEVWRDEGGTGKMDAAF